MKAFFGTVSAGIGLGLAISGLWDLQDHHPRLASAVGLFLGVAGIWYVWQTERESRRNDDN